MLRCLPFGAAASAAEEASVDGGTSGQCTSASRIRKTGIRLESLCVGDRQHRRIGAELIGGMRPNRRRGFVVVDQKLGRIRRSEHSCRGSVRHRRLVGCRRHHLHDVEALLFKLLEQARQRRHSLRMNVVQQQNAFAALFQTAHGQRNDLCRSDVAVPVVGHHVGGEDDQPAFGKLALKEVGTFESGNAEEWRQVSGIAAERGTDVGNAAVDFGRCMRSTGNLPKPIG